MSDTKFYAKSDGAITIEEHTNALLNLFDIAENYLKTKISEDLLKVVRKACEYHDLGKISTPFQKKIYEAMGKNLPPIFLREKTYKMYDDMHLKEVPHGLLSGMFINTKELINSGYTDEQIKLLVTAVCNHHTINEQIESDKIAYGDIVEIDLKINSEEFKSGLFLSSRSSVKNMLSTKTAISKCDNAFFNDFRLVKGLLNKFDYAASAGATEIDMENSDWRERTLDMMNGKYKLRECQEYLLDKTDENVVMVASTGIGKTEASMLWIANDKAFYTLPVKVSLNAMYARLRGHEQYEKEKIALLHSDALSILINGQEDSYENNQAREYDPLEKYKKTRSLSYPLTICTVDQLFTFVYSAIGTEILPATLSYSKLVIDEIQSYSPKILASILYGLKIINDMGGKFLIMTATLPPHVVSYLQENTNVHVTPPFLLDKKRHMCKCFVDKESFDIELIAEKAKRNKVLVICNTVPKAKQVYDELKKNDVNCKLLHARFIQQDRQRIEKEIKEFAENKDSKGVWVTTQLVEASLDIDFDVLFTEMSTCDSLLQRMGRCWRNRNEDYQGDDPNIYIIDSKNGYKCIYDKDIYDRSIKFLKDYENKIFLESDKQEYINKVYNENEIRGSEYMKQFEKSLEFFERGLMYGEISKEDAGKMFRDINTTSVIPFEFVDCVKELEKEFNACKSKEERKKLETKIMQYTVSVNFNNRAKATSVPKKIMQYTVSANPYSKKYNFSKERVFGYMICNNNYSHETGLAQGEEESFLDRSF